MLDLLKEMLSYPFLWRAMLVGILVSVCASMLGVSLVLKRYSMLGDGLSHVGFGALAIAAAAGAAPMTVAIPVVVASAVILLWLESSGKLKGDAATALVSTGSIAVGVMLVSIGGGTNIDLGSYMFGSILALTSSDVTLSVVVSCAVLALYILCYPRIFAVTFDENFARATGTHAGLFNMLLAVLTALTIVLGMRLTGAMLISALIVFPPSSAMKLFHSFKAVVVSSAVLSAVCFAAGMTMSYFWSLPSGASVVLCNIAAFALCCFIGTLKRRAAVR